MVEAVQGGARRVNEAVPVLCETQKVVGQITGGGGGSGGGSGGGEQREEHAAVVRTQLRLRCRARPAAARPAPVFDARM